MNASRYYVAIKRRRRKGKNKKQSLYTFQNIYFWLYSLYSLYRSIVDEFMLRSFLAWVFPSPSKNKQVVIANGVEAGEILSKLGYKQLPLVVDRGATIQMPRSKEAITRPIHVPSAAAYIVPMNDAPLCSGTSHITSPTSSPNETTTRFLRRMVMFKGNQPNFF